MRKLKKLIKNPKLFFYDALKKRLPTDIKKDLPSLNKDIECYFDELLNFIQNYDVNSMKINNEYMWPYLRNHLISNLYEVSMGKPKFKDLLPLNLQNGHHSQISSKFRALIKKEYSGQDVEDLETIKTDFLFFVPMNGFGRVDIDKKIYHRIIDPLFSSSKSCYSSLKIEIIKNSHLPAIKYWHRYAHKSTIILPPVIAKSGYSQDLIYDKKFFSVFKKNITSLNTPNETLLKQVFDYELHTKYFYLDLLKKLNPKVICLYGFHYNAPLISAAHELGILSVDIQHGLQVGWSLIYNKHEELPSTGYQAYPNVFAVWGDKECNHIKYNLTSNKHTSLLIGNYWLNTLSKFPHTLSNSLKKKLSEEKTYILIILRDQTTIDKMLLDIIQNSDKNIRWVVRHHPSSKNKFTPKDFKTTNILIDLEIDKVQFHELFQYIDITISEGSALALEASYFNIENIIISSFGYQNYIDEIRSGQFYFMHNAQEFTNIIQKIKKNKSRSPTLHNISPEEALKKLLVLSDKLKKSYHELNSSKNETTDFTQLLTITNTLNEINKKIDSTQIEKVLKIFYSLRDCLTSLTEVTDIYNRKIDFAMKEAKILRRKMQQTVHVSNSSNAIYMIGDSISLPRRNSPVTTSMIISDTSTAFSIITWGQRYLETNKLLAYWSHIIQNIENKHVVIHLGITDCYPRVYTEKQYIGLKLLPQDLHDNIVKFSSHYQEEILNNQKENSYVSLKEFTSNLEKIIEKLIHQKPKSITFINIINHPKLNIDVIPSFNDTMNKISLKFSMINVLDLDTILKQKGYDPYVLDDHIHLNIHGHKLLTRELIKLLNTKRRA